jgi:hypothetical protein
MVLAWMVRVWTSNVWLLNSRKMMQTIQGVSGLPFKSHACIIFFWQKPKSRDILQNLADTAFK